MPPAARSLHVCALHALGSSIALLLAGSASVLAQAPERLPDGIALTIGGRRLEVRVCREDVVRVVEAAPGPFFSRKSLPVVADACAPTMFDVQAGRDAVTVATARLQARVALPAGTATFLDRSGRPLLAEKSGGRTFAPAEVMGERTFHVRAEFEPNDGEAFYGLGAHQSGLMNYAGHDVDLFKLNTVDIVPFLVSSRGYGILWDNTSHTRFGDPAEPVHVPANRLYDATGKAGGLTGTYRQGDCQTGTIVGTRVDPQIAFGAPEDRPPVSAIHQAPQTTNEQLHPRLGRGDVCVAWEGAIEGEKAGEYDILTFATNGLRVTLDGKVVVDTWRQTIPIRWDEKAGTLTIGRRAGSFPGMSARREFRIVFVTPATPVPHGATPPIARTVTYEGQAVVVKAGR